MIQIGFLSDETEFNDIIALSDLINEVYEDAEAGFWIPGHQRIDPEELQVLIRREEIIVASDNNEIVASICIHEISKKRLEFRMLVTDPAYRNKGIGKQLIEFAEDHARKNHYTEMQLVLVKPTNGVHKGKEELDRWYRSMGYQPEKKENLAEVLPHLKAKMATECICEIFSKQL